MFSSPKNPETLQREVLNIWRQFLRRVSELDSDYQKQIREIISREDAEEIKKLHQVLLNNAQTPSSLQSFAPPPPNPPLN